MGQGDMLRGRSASGQAARAARAYVRPLEGVDQRDSRLIDLAARSYFPELLAAGGRVYEYESRFIHAKTLVCDDDVAVIGTANLDNRSFRLNFEVAAVIYSGSINFQLAEAFTTDLNDSRELAAGVYDKLPLTRRLGHATARLISPLL